MYNSLKMSIQPQTQVLECRVCLDVFGLVGDKVPRLLHCGHSVCQACLERFPIRDDVVECPFDRQPTPVGNFGVWGLKKNFALVELLERLQDTQERESDVIMLSPDALHKERELGIRCDENDAHTAVLYCTVCTTHLCEVCSEASHVTRTLARHRRVPLSEKPRERPRCPAHPALPAEFVCLQDECQASAVMCFICKDYGPHKNHKHALVEVEAENIRSWVLNACQHIFTLAFYIGKTFSRLELEEASLDACEGEPSSVSAARARVLEQYFTQVRETLPVRSGEELEEDLIILYHQVAEVVLQCKITIKQDDARVLAAGQELKDALTPKEKLLQQIADLSPDRFVFRF